MQRSLLQIDNIVFRANPDYELVEFERLSPQDRRVLQGLENDPDLHGLLLPRCGSQLGVKSACRDTALLFFSLQTPGVLPKYPRGPDNALADVAQLVLDGILELQSSERFVSGPRAYELLYGATLPPGSDRRDSNVSISALKYAQSLSITDKQRLSARLYCYNRLPVSPAWHRRLETAERVMTYLGLDDQTGLARLLDRDWYRPSDEYHDGWLSWQTKRSPRSKSNGGPTYKLYISPTCAQLNRVFAQVVSHLSRCRASSFKIGANAFGLLRPDKLVAYFETFEDMSEAAALLVSALEGCDAHGVPFTAELGLDGLLSWGVDPSRKQHIPSWLQHQSWRFWLTNRLAAALIDAKYSQGDAIIEPWHYALERVGLDGVDTDTWIPTDLHWEINGGGQRIR